MNYQIGVTPYRGCEVTVIIDRQSEMSRIVGGILGFCHASDRNFGNDRIRLGVGYIRKQR